MMATVQKMGIAALAALALSLSSPSSARPNLLMQQGRLFDAETDKPLGGMVTVVFTLYDDAEASEPENVLWTEMQSVTLDNGYFSAVLGEEEALDPALFDGSVRYLGVKVGADDELTPRQVITSVPYALSAPWSGIRDHAPPCEAPKFLRGFDATGTPQCVSASLKCTRRTERKENATQVYVSCNEGETMTGGGCSAADQPLRESLPFGNAWQCGTTAPTTVGAATLCCRVE